MGIISSNLISSHQHQINLQPPTQSTNTATMKFSAVFAVLAGLSAVNAAALPIEARQTGLITQLQATISSLTEEISGLTGTALDTVTGQIDNLQSILDGILSKKDLERRQTGVVSQIQATITALTSSLNGLSGTALTTVQTQIANFQSLLNTLLTKKDVSLEARQL